MKLADWLARIGTSAAALAERCGVPALTVHKRQDGADLPRPEHSADLATATREGVTADDCRAAVAEAPVAARPDGVRRPLLRDPEVAGWRDENRAAMEAHARHVEEHGTPLGKHRMVRRRASTVAGF